MKDSKKEGGIADRRGRTIDEDFVPDKSDIAAARELARRVSPMALAMFDAEPFTKKRRRARD